MIGEYFDLVKASGDLRKRRNKQNINWMNALIEEALIGRLNSNSKIKSLLLELETSVKKLEITPYAAATQVVQALDEL